MGGGARERENKDKLEGREGGKRQGREVERDVSGRVKKSRRSFGFVFYDMNGKV